MKIKGRLFVIEGIDSCGKGLQVRLLLEKFKKEDRKVLIQDFPRYYTSKFGKMVGEFLIGKYGKFDEIDPHLALPLYMLDQYTWSREVGIPWLNGGGIILLDRYFTSNVHQVAKKKGRAKKSFRDWMWDLGYKELKILKPDMVIFLDVSPNITKRLIKQKTDRKYLGGKKKDGAEKNWQHQWEAYKEYLYMTKYDKSWMRVKCMTKGKIDDPQVIHKRIWDLVSRFI